MDFKPESTYSALLVNPPKDREQDDYYSEFLPLNLLAIATRLKMAHISTVVIDALPGTRDIEEITRQIRAMLEDNGALVVGIALYQTTADNAIKIAKFCQDIRASTKAKVKVVIGGVNATLFAEHYLRKHGDVIDGVIMGHGEDAMIHVCRGEDAPNLLTLEKPGSGIDADAFYDTDLDIGFPYDYSGIDLRHYWQYSAKRFSTKGARFTQDQMSRPLLINTHRGCYLSCMEGEKTRKCVFCGQREYRWKGIDPQDFWYKLTQAMKKTSANCVSDLGDNFLGNIEWFKELMRHRPKDFKYPFKYVFASSDRLCDEEVVRLLAEELQLHAVLNSIEHGDQRCQSAFGKQYTAEQTERSLELLERYRIASRLSFVIGAPRTAHFDGESEETIKNFIEYAKRIAQRRCIQVILGNVLNPSPGSKVFNSMMARGRHRDSYKAMLPKVDKELMSRHYFEEFTQISRERAEEAMRQIMDLFADDVIKGETV